MSYEREEWPEGTTYNHTVEFRAMFSVEPEDVDRLVNELKSSFTDVWIETTDEDEFFEVEVEATAKNVYYQHSEIEEEIIKLDVLSNIDSEWAGCLVEFEEK